MMKKLVLILTALSMVILTGSASAADDIKANNATALNLVGSWVDGSVPTLANGDVATWDATVAGANTVAIGGNLSVLGIKVTSPGGAVVVTHAAGNTLTLGSAGINMSAATQNLTLLNTANTACDINISASQIWNVNAARTLVLWSNSNSANQRLTGGGNIEITGGGIVRVLTGDSSSTGTGAGAGNDTFSGNWTITNGSVRGLRNGTHAWGTGTIYMNGGTLGGEQGNWMWNNNIVLNTGTTSTFDDFNTSGTTRTLKLMGVISGDGNVTFNDSSSRSGNDTGYILTGSNSLSGTVTLGTGADVRVGGVNTANDLTTNTSGTGGTLGTASVNLSSATSVLTISRSDNYTFANTVSGSGVLRIGMTTASNNTGITTVSGNNSHGGGTRIQSAATLNFGHVNAAGTGAIIISGNGSFDNGTGGNLVVANALEMSGGSPTFIGTNSMTINGAVTISGANRTLTVTANTLTLGGNIGQDASARNLTKAGAGTLKLTGANSTYTGNTTISNGTLDLTGGKLYTNAHNNTAVVTVNGTVLVNNYSYGAANSFGMLSDYAGRRVLDGGTLEVQGASHISGQDFTVNAAGGTFRYNPTNVADTLTLTGNNNTDTTINGTLTFDAIGNITVDDTTDLVSGIITGTGGLIKTGGGTLTLNAANTYAGTTAVNNGTLRLDGSLTSAVTVASGAKLQGIGTITKTGTALTVNGTLAPGNSIGQLTVNGDVTLAGASDFEIDPDIDGSDLLLVQGTNGALTYGGTLNVSILTGSTGIFAMGDTFDLFNFASQSGTFGTVNLPDISGQGYSWDQSALYTAGTITVIPEPATVGMIGLVGAMALLRRRMKIKG